MKKLICLFLLLFFVFPAARAEDAKQIILAATTSVQDTGLLDVLIPVFEAKSGYKVKPIAIGTGQAIKMAMNGEADVILVHSPEQEKKFMDEGYGTTKRAVMHNYFIIVGPKNDPAGVKNAASPVNAFERIAAIKASFVSRGDNSGTNAKEKALWEKAKVMPARAWYIESGTGMAVALRIAGEKNAYILSDKATYLSLKKSLNLKILYEGGNDLLNTYNIIELNPVKIKKINIAGGKAFADFILSKEGQEIINRFGVEKFKEQLFIPGAAGN